MGHAGLRCNVLLRSIEHSTLQRLLKHSLPGIRMQDFGSRFDSWVVHPEGLLQNTAEVPMLKRGHRKLLRVCSLQVH